VSRTRHDLIAELDQTRLATARHRDPRVPRPAPAAVAILVGVASIVSIATAHGPVRAVLVSLSFLIVPAVAITGWFEPTDLMMTITIGLGVDVACAVLCAQILVWVDWWAPSTLWVALMLLAQVSLVAQLNSWQRARVSRRSRA
jgi:hypothetical protein